MLFSGAPRFGLFLAAARGSAGLLVATVVLACALLPSSASSAAPGGAGYARVGRDSELSLSGAPAGLRAAVRRTLGARVASGGWSPQAKLSERHGTGGEAFGSSVAVSGQTAVVGVYGKNSETGVAYVFVRSGRTWSQQAKLSARRGGPLDRFGFSVAIFGQTAVVGAPGMALAYVFVRSGRTWSQQAKLTAPGGAASNYGAEFGYSVAVSGQTAVVGADAYDKTGAAYVFVRSGTTWSPQQRLTASDAAPSAYFGTSVAISGSTAVVGAPFGSETGATYHTGAAYVFVRSGTTWSQQNELTASDASAGTTADFGWSVALSGATMIVGAYAGRGAAYVFVRSGTTWSPQQKLTATDAVKGDEFGYSVAISGATTVIGADQKNKMGAAYVFVRSGTSWSQQQKLTASDGVKGDDFGYSLAISGTTAVIGAPAPGKRYQTGAAYVFVRG